MTPPDELQYWLAFAYTSYLGITGVQQLLDRYPDPKEIFSVSESDLIGNGVPAKLAASLKNPNWKAVEKDLAWADKPNHYILSWNHPDYPQLLKQTSGAPLVLFIRGNIELLNKKQIAIVGSRNPSPTGSDTAFEFAKALAQHGLVITSGLALGIDAASHRGALTAKESTIAVMGSGHDHIYPANHKTLADEIVDKGGSLVTEFSPYVLPKAENFPRRNRIISGLSLGVLVVEAALKSGSLITARLALEQNREVFAIPGSIHNPLARGCHSLIKQGAKLVETASDIFEELQSLSQAISNLSSKPLSLKDWIPRTNQGETNINHPSDENQAKLLQHIGDETTPIDLLIARTGLTAEIVSSMLIILELQGFIAAVTGGYVKCIKRRQHE